jgi:4-amino-4-deoxy-L-arabinose transferase-like glycosyltransferase
LRRPRDTPLILLFGAALGLRLLVVFLEPATRPLGDEPSWLAVADAVKAAGFHPLRLNGMFYPPLYPYLIAAVHGLFGTLTAVKIVQCLVGALLVPVVASVGTRAYSRAAGLAAAAMAALSPVSAWYAAHFWAEPLFVLLLWVGIERVLAGDETDRLAPTIAGGAALGLAALAREPALYFVPVAALWLAARRDARSLPRAGALLATALLMTGLWTIRNYACYGAFVPVSTMGGRALWEGNTGRTRGEVYAEYDEVGAEQGMVAQHRFAIAEALREIEARQPQWIFEKIASEVPHLLSPDNMVLTQVRRRGYGRVTRLEIWLVAGITILPYLVLLGFFVLGLARLVPSRARVLLLAFLAFYVVLHVVVHGHHRFRLPMLPAMYAIAASALPAAGAALAPFTPRRRALAVVLAILLAACLVPGFVGMADEPAFRRGPAR